MSGTGALDATDVEAVFVVFADLVASHASFLDRINAFPVPDADTGRNLSATVRAALAATGATSGSVPSSAPVDPAPPRGGVALRVDARPVTPSSSAAPRPISLAALCTQLADGAFLGARGNSGTILAQLLAGFFEVAAHGERLDAPALAAALAHAAEVGPLAVAEVIEGTMLTVADVVGRAARAVVEAAPPIPDVVDVLDAAWAMGQQALARTIEQNPVLAAAGVVDAGAAGYLLLLDAFLHVVDGRPVPVPDLAQAPPSPPASGVGPSGVGGADRGTAAAGDDQAVVSDAYEVMFLLECQSPGGHRPAGRSRPGLRGALRGDRCARRGGRFRRGHRAPGELDLPRPHHGHRRRAGRCARARPAPEGAGGAPPPRRVSAAAPRP